MRPVRRKSQYCDYFDIARTTSPRSELQGSTLALRPFLPQLLVVEPLLLRRRFQMDAEKAHSLLRPLGDIKPVWYRAFIGCCEMQVRFIIDATRREKEYFCREMFDCPNGCFAEVVVESPVRRMDDAVEIWVIVDPRHGRDHSKSELVLAFDWPQSEYPIFRHSQESRRRERPVKEPVFQDRQTGA